MTASGGAGRAARATPEAPRAASYTTSGDTTVGALAEAHNLPLTSHGAHDVTVQLLASAPNRSYLEVHGFSLDRFVAHLNPF